MRYRVSEKRSQRTLERFAYQLRLRFIFELQVPRFPVRQTLVKRTARPLGRT